MAMNDDSILESIKKVLGLSKEYTVFDADVLMHINSIFATLHQIGLGANEGFYVVDSDVKWSQYLNDQKVDAKLLHGVKSYMYLRARLLFDPPTTSFALSALQDQAKEAEWRLNATVDPPPSYS